MNFKERLDRVFTPRPVVPGPKARSRVEGGKFVADVTISSEPVIRKALAGVKLAGAKLRVGPSPKIEAISPCDASNGARRIEALSRRAQKAQERALLDQARGKAVPVSAHPLAGLLAHLPAAQRKAFAKALQKPLAVQVTSGGQGRTMLVVVVKTP